MNEPDDIRATAVSVYSRYLKDVGGLSLVDLLAEALMAERERNRQDIENLLAAIAARNEALERYENDQMGL